MFDDFQSFLNVSSSITYDNSLNSLANFKNMFSSTTINNGLLFAVLDDDIVSFNSIIIKAFPFYEDKIHVFAVDWLGRFFAVSSNSCVLAFDIACNSVSTYSFNLIDFLNPNINIDFADVFCISTFNDWVSLNPSIIYCNCVGFITPAFLGGQLSFDNLEVIDIFDYWNNFIEILPPQTYSSRLNNHYSHFLGSNFTCITPNNSSLDFSVYKFPPNEDCPIWRYSTFGLSCSLIQNLVEFFVFSPVENDSLIDVLYDIALSHINDKPFGLNDCIPLVKPWFDNSLCNHFLVAMPSTEETEFYNFGDVFCYWLIPITSAEVEFKNNFGIEALEQQFLDCELDFLDISRDSII